MGKAAFLTVLALAASAVAGPLDRSGSCSRQCTENAKFLYKPGTSYNYEYNSDAITTMQGTTQEESRLHLKAQVEIHVISKCDFIMKLTGVTLEHSDPTNPRSRRSVNDQDTFKQSLERYTLRFSFQDGRVEAVCPAEGETAQVLNIKRGILSVLQTSADSLKSPEKVVETDIAGKCIVNYEPMGQGWNSVTIRKIKDLSTCTERSNADTAIQVNPFAATKSMPLVKGKQECQQVFKNNRLESSMCTESHVFRPFSRQEGGAMTKVVQALTFKNEKTVAFTGADYSNLMKAMTFDHEPETPDRLTRKAEMTFVDLCMAAKDEIKQSVPGKFTAFVYSLRNLEHTDIVNLNRRVERVCPDNEKAKKMFLDAAAMAGTPGSIQFIVDLLQRGEMPENEIELWISTLAFVNKPNKETVTALMPLLDGSRMSALLPVSAVIHTYCRLNEGCELQNEVRLAVRKITSLLGNRCSGDKAKVMLALKALGNIGVSSEAEEKLQTCTQNNELENEVRVAAIQAYRRFNCEVLRSPIQDLYTSQEEDVEVRIAAFLAVMRCPSQSVFMKVRDTMEAEKIKQVGSFVMTYLKNIEDKSAFKNDIHEIVSNIDYLNKFESDIRKFSRNYQNSFFINAIESGLNVDSNIIFEPTSYLPRTAMLNLTVDMMGNSVNILEMDGRAESLDKLVESMFGPEGYFRKEKPQTTTRSKKSIFDNKIEDMEKKFEVKKRFEKDPSLSLDVKIFGNSLWYKKITQGNMATEAFNVMDIMVELAKEQEMEFTKSFLFLDTTVTIPTGSGLPMKLAINGSAVMDLKMSGKVDAKSLQNIDIRGKIQPSGAIEIATFMSVEAGSAKTGLKMVATMHTSTFLDGLVQVRNGKVYQARLNVPKEQMEIFNVQSRIYLVSSAEEREQKGMNDDISRYTQCTGRFTKTPLGVELCGELQLPAVGRKEVPLYPFNGPASMSLFLRKTDPKLTHYNMELRWTEDKVGRDVTGQNLLVSFNTPESEIDREISAEFNLNKVEETVSMKFKVPNKKVSLTGKRVMNENEKRLSMAMSIDDIEKFSLSTSMMTEDIEGGMRYQPTLEVRGPTGRLINIRGAASLKHLKYSGEIVVEDLTAKPMVFNGEMSVGERDRYEGNLNIESYALTANVKTHAQFRNGFSSKLSVQYRVMEGESEKLEITSKLRDLSANGLAKYNGAVSLVSSALPEYTTAITWDSQFTTGHVENSLELSFGDGRIRRVQKISMLEVLRFEGNLEDNKVDGNLRLTYPEKDIDFALTMNHQNTMETLKNKMILKYAPAREATTTVDLKMSGKPLKLTSDIQVKYPGREMKLLATVNQMQNREFETAVTAQWQRGKQIRAVGVIRDRSTREGKDYQGNLELTVPNSRPISLSSQLTTLPGRYVISADGEFGRGNYGLKGEYTTTSIWNHRISALVKTPKKSYSTEATLQKNKEKFIGKMDVNLPDVRRVTGNVEISNGGKVKTVAFDVMWDADGDQNQRATMEAEFRQNADGHQVKFSYKCPCKTLAGAYNINSIGQFSSGVMRGNMHAELEWENNEKIMMDLGGNMALKSTRRQINGEIKMTTPYTENMAITVQHTDTWPEWNNKMTVQWKRNSKIILGTEGKMRSDSISSFLDTSMRINTPFRNYETLSLREVFEMRPTEISSSSTVQWGSSKTIDLGVSGSFIGSDGIRAGINFTSPFNTLRDLTVSLSHSLSRKTIDSDIELRWNGRNSVVMNFDGRNTMSGKKHTCSAEGQILTTIRNYEKLNTKIVYNNDGREANLNSDLRWNNNKITVGVNGVNRNTHYGYDMESKLTYSSSFRNFESGEIKIAHINDAQKFTSNIESRLPYNHNLNLKVQGNMPSIREMDSTLVLGSSLVKDVSYEVAYKMEGDRFAANGMANYGNQKVSGDIIGTLSSGNRAWDIDYKVNLNTPFVGFEEIKFNLVQSRRNLQFTTRMQASRNQNTISLNHDLKIESFLNFDNKMRLTTPYRQLRSIELNINQNGKTGEYKHISQLNWGNKKAFLTMDLNTRSPRRGRFFEARVNAKSPFQKFSSLDIELKHEDDERNYKPSFSVEWNDVNKISLDAVLNNDKWQMVETRLTGTSSFNGYENLAFSGKYDLTTPRKTAEFTYRWNTKTNEVVSFKGLIEANSNKGMTDLMITSPIRGYEVVQYKADYSLDSTENLVNIFTSYGSNKFSFNGKHIKNNNGQEINAQVSTPLNGYEKLIASGSYKINKHDMSTEMSYEWESDKKVVLIAEYRSRNGKMVTKLNVNSPFKSYKKLALKLEGDVQSPKKTFSSVIQWESNKMIQADIAFESDYSRFGNININFRSPFNDFKEITMNGEAKILSGEFNAEANLQWMPTKRITGTVLLKPTEVSLSLDTPFEPFRNVRLTSNLKRQNSDATIEARLEWENTNKADISANYRLSEKLLEGGMKINYPYKGMQTYSAKGRIMNDNFKMMEGRVDIETSYKGAEKIELGAVIRNDDNSHDLTMTFTGPSTRLTLSGNVVNRNYRDMEGSLNMDSNIPSIKNFEAKASYKNSNWKMVQVKGSFNSVHSIESTFKNDDRNYKVDASVESPMIPSKRLSMSFTANTKDIRDMDSSLAIQAASERHVLTISEKVTKRGFESEIKVNSRLINRNEVNLNVVYNNNNNKNIEGKISGTYNQEPHTAEFRFNNENRETVGSVNIQCSLVPSGKMNLEARLSRPTDNSVETLITLVAGNTRHSVSTSAKVLDNQMEFTVNLDSPNVSPRMVTLTATLTNDYYKNIAGSVSLKSSTSESRMAFNMRRNEWRDVDAFFTLNLPIETLSMIRVDLKMKNDGLKSMEGSLDILTSLNAMRSLSMSGKMKNTESAWDMSVNFKLPVKKLENISLLATVHKNQDMSRVAPRITLSLPNKKYVVYANYENNGNDLVANIGSELEGKKWEISVDRRANEIRVTLVTPVRSYERYSLLANVNNEKGKRSGQIVFEDASNQKYTIDGTLNFNNVYNFNGDVTIRMPTLGYRELSTKVTQRYRRGRWNMIFEHNMDRNNKLSLTIDHTNSPTISGTVQITTPMDQYKNMKAIYSYEKAQNTKGKVDLEMNTRNVLHMEMERAYLSDARAYSNNVQIELPTLPYTLTVSYKPLPAGSEVSAKSVLPSRTVNFKTMYQATSSVFSHLAQFSWDERSDRTISYEIRNTATSRQGNEYFGRLNMPIRSIEVRTTHEKTSTGRKVTGDLYWDASRDQTRNMKIAMEHTDNSNRYNFAHKIRLSTSHPQLSKDIVCTAECLLSPNEIYGKTEIEYSRFPQNNIFLEARASNTAQSRRESRYTASLAARHSVANLDMKVSAELANTQQEMKADLKMNYVDRNRRQQIQELRANIMKVKQHIELMARSNENKINMLGRMFHRDNELTLALEQTINNESPVLSHFRLSKQHRNMELNITSLSGNRVHLKASMPEDHLQAELNHVTSGREFSDAKFYLGLRDRKILESRINWRPEMYSEVQDTVSSTYNRQYPAVLNAMNDLQNEISTEFSSKVDLMSRSLAQESRPFATEITKEMKKMRVDMQRGTNELYQMYRRDEFFMRTGSESMEGIFKYIRKAYNEAVNYIYRNFEIFCETLSMTIDIAMNIMNEAIEGLIRMSQNWQKQASIFMNKFGKKMAQIKKEYLDKMAAKTIEIASKVASRMGDVMVTCLEKAQQMIQHYMPAVNQLMVTLQRAAKDLTSWVKERYGDQLAKLMENPAYKAMSEYYVRVLQTVGEFFEQISYNQMLKSTRMLMDNAAENVNAAYTYIRDHPNLSYVNEVASRVFEQTRKVVKEFGMNTMMVNILEDLYQKTQQLAWNTLRDLVDEYGNFHGNARYVFAPEEGKIEMEMRLPVVRNSLKQLLDVNSYPQIQKLKELGSQLSFGDFCIWDSYYKYKRYLDVNYWLPPFKAQAMLIGNQHFMTFDNFNYDFAGECSYLLARDFDDGNFTCTVNFVRDNNRVIKKSLNIFTDGVKVEISRDNKVTIDDRKVELPQEIGKTSLTMEDGVISVSNSLGYKIKCNFVHDLCTMEVSGFYFGKTGGLFGTNNYEPSLDMMTPNNKVADSLESFSDSWQVGSAQCNRGKNLAFVPSTDSRAEEKCNRIFKNENSEFRSGFRQVDPEPFLRMCINDVSAVREAEQMTKMCSSAAAYVERCRQQGVNLNMPKHCVRCQRLSADDMESGDVVKITKDEPVRAADVVFVVEEKDCNKDISKMLSKMAQSIDDGFRKNGYRQVHFAVVGFGGNGIFSEPHVVTSDSQVFGTVRNIDSALNSMNFGNGDSNIFMALRYAAGLPFMTGSTKTFVLAKCSACKVEEMKADYSEMLRTMLDSDITLHLLMDHEFETKSGKQSIGKKVIGLDRKYAYTQKNAGDKDLLAQVKTPKDLCVPLALEVNGSFFSTARLFDNKRNINKKSMEVLSRRVIKTAEPAECQICECIATQNGIGKSVCQRCVSPVVAQLVSDDISPMYYYGSETENESTNAIESEEVEDVIKAPVKPQMKKMSRKNKKNQ